MVLEAAVSQDASSSLPYLAIFPSAFPSGGINKYYTYMSPLPAHLRGMVGGGGQVLVPGAGPW